jgi:phage terminase large subunit-like protein
MVVHSQPSGVAEEDLLKGLSIIHRDTHGRYSLSDQVALRAQEQLGSTAGLIKHLGLTPAEVLTWKYEPRYHLRPAQQNPSALVDAGGNALFPFWRTWFLLGGRGAGKTHAGSAGVIEEARADPEARILIVGPTWSLVRETQLEGPSGILTLSPPWFRPEFKVSRKELHWPNGARGFCVSAEKAGKFRGKGMSYIWADEIVAWEKNPIEVYRECTRVLRFPTARATKLGLPPRMCITTTPAPTQLFREILQDRDGLVLARSTTLDNASNLPPQYLRQALAGLHTTEGRREYGGELFFALDANLYRKVNWEKTRIKSLAHLHARPEKYGDWAPARLQGQKISTPFDFIVISVDPATGEKKGADLHGIVVLGFRWEPDFFCHSYVLADLSLQAPEASAWAKKAVDAWKEWKTEAPAGKCWVFAETNTGGSMVKQVLRAQDAKVKVKGQRAMQSKAERASPVSILCEADQVHMVGRHHALEKQLAAFTGQEGGHARDDRADAFAWPIYLYVCPKRAMRGVGSAGDKKEEEDEESEE